jgi:hypothetical protein
VSTRLSAIVLGLIFPAAVAANDRTFERSVAPILRRHCVRCHQGDKAKGGLDLTSVNGLAAGAEGTPVVVAGKPDESRLIEVVSGDRP